MTNENIITGKQGLEYLLALTSEHGKKAYMLETGVYSDNPVLRAELEDRVKHLADRIYTFGRRFEYGNVKKQPTFKIRF